MCWRCREAGRFQSGEYKRVPWHTEPWARNNSETVWHYVHVSRHDATLVAYTASEEHGEADRQTRVTPGRYLTRFYGKVLMQKDIQYWCGQFKGEHWEEIELKFASEPDEIAWVYENGPMSCMAGGADGFATDGVHPASVYGAGDLAIAYLVYGGKVKARAICWPAKNIYGRQYGDDYTLTAKLKAAGYRPGDKAEFDGARLLQIECASGLVCPYLDVGSSPQVEVGGKYLIIGRGSIGAARTDGIAQMGTQLCPSCNEYYASDDGCYVQDVEEYWCPECADETAVCDNCSERYTDEIMTRVHNDDMVCAQCLARRYEYCEVCEGYHHQADGLCESEEGEEEEETTPAPTVQDPHQVELRFAANSTADFYVYVYP